MSNSPKVSIVIPVYNRSELIKETLKSAINQTYNNIEIIVVDNKSTDKTFEILEMYSKKFDNVFCFQNDQNIGIVRNWRKAVELATGNYIHILWSDDLIAPTFIEKTLPFLLENKNIGFVYTKTAIFNSTGNLDEVFGFGKTDIYNIDIFFQNSLLKNPLAAPVSPANALFRSKDVKNNLLLNIPNDIGADYSMLGIGNDVLIFLLTGQLYTHFAFINETLSFFRSHDESITLSTKRMDVAIYYHVAKAYFVEYYDIPNAIKRKFYTKLKMLKYLFVLTNFFDKSNKHKGFPIKKNRIDYSFLFIYTFEVIAYLIKRFIKKIKLYFRDNNGKN